MKKPANNEETKKAMHAWLDGYPKFKGIMVLFDASDGTITDLANCPAPMAMGFAIAYKSMVEQQTGMQPIFEIQMPPMGMPNPFASEVSPDEICDCRVEELETVLKYIEQPGHTIDGLKVMIETRLERAKAEE